MPADLPDMIVGEVKEGVAEFNQAGRRPDVLAAADEPHLRVPLGHVTRYLEHWIDEHGNVMGHTQLKDPVLAFLVALATARRGLAEA